jgi:hypothetical protein
MQVPTLRELVEFVLAHRGKTVFIDMSEDEIALEILEASKDDRLAYHVEPGIGVTGIMILDIDKPNKILFVRRNLNTTPRAVISMCCIFEHYFSSYRLQGIKHGFKEYKDPIKLVTRWAAMSARKLQSSTT